MRIRILRNRPVEWDRFDTLSALRVGGESPRWVEAGIVVPEVGRGTVPLTEPPTFSVVIPVYQGAETIGEAISTVFSQTVAPFEVIVCDDGSTDDLSGALAPFTGRITVLRQEHRGVAAARNLGLFHASGDFVMVTDSDDVLLPRTIECYGALAMARPDLDILAANGYFARDDMIVATWCLPGDRKATFPSGDQRMGIVRDNLLPGSAAMRRQRLIDIGGYDETLRVAEDYDVSTRLIFSGGRAGLLLEPLHVIRLRLESLSHNKEWDVEGRIAVLTKLLASDDLSPAERAVAEKRVAEYRRWPNRIKALAAAKASMLEGHGDVRRLSFRVAMQRGHGIRTRTKAAGAMIAPRWASRQIRL